MSDKITTYIISFIVCIILFVSETLLLIQYNMSKGIKRQDVIEIIDDFDIEDEIKKMDDYYKIENILGEEQLNEIINSNELNKYVKENAKSIYLKIMYGENLNSESSLELREYINNKLDTLHELNQITEEQEIEVSSIINTIINEAENDIEETINVGNIIEKFLSNKTTTYMIIITILLSLSIIVINKSKTGLIFVGIPTIITGILFLILELSLTQKINIIGIDEKAIYTVNTYLPNLIKTLKKSSIIMTLIGFIECGLYKVLNYQEVGNKNGEN